MRYILPMVLGWLICLKANAQVNTHYIDSLATKMIDIKEELVKIKENYYIIMPFGIAGNIGVYLGKDQVVLVDDQWSVLSSRLKEILSTITNKPIKYIVNTHFHYDHTNGNLSFGKENIPIIAHTNARSRMARDQELPGVVNILQKAYPEEALPAITFSDSLQLNDGIETIELIHFKNAHTDGDVFVHFKKADIYHTGDVFVTYGLPFIDEINGGDIYGMIKATEYLLSVAKPETKIIPGHGPLCTSKEVSAYRNLLVSIRDQVIDLIKKGMTLDQVTSAVKIDPKIEGVSRAQFIPQVYRMVLKHENINVK
jgi:cyclase